MAETTRTNDPLADYPTLSALLGELQTMEARERVRQAMQAQEPNRLQAPWLKRSFEVTEPQRQVFRRLLDAWVSSEGEEVPERELLRAAGVKGSSVAELFQGSDAWGELVVPGRKPGTFRLGGIDSILG